MPFNATTVIAALFAHFLGDFILQTDWMAKNKSKNYRAFTAHLLSYTIPFWIPFGWKFTLVNVALHGAIDWVTSRVTSSLYAKGRIHDFFVVIGFDQFLHATCLILTLRLLVP